MESKSPVPKLELIVVLVVMAAVFGGTMYYKYSASEKEREQWLTWMDGPAEVRELSDVLVACQLAGRVVPEDLARRLTNGGARALAVECSTGGKTRVAAQEQQDREELIKALARAPASSAANSASQISHNK